jgi:hypothetical protein
LCVDEGGVVNIAWQLVITEDSIEGLYDTEDYFGCGGLYMRGMYRPAGPDTSHFVITALEGGSCTPVIWDGVWNSTTETGSGTWYNSNGTFTGSFSMALGPCTEDPFGGDRAFPQSDPDTSLNEDHSIFGVQPDSGSSPTALCDSFGMQWQLNITGDTIIGVREDLVGCCGSGCMGAYARGMFRSIGPDTAHFVIGTLKGTGVFPFTCLPMIWDGIWDSATGTASGTRYMSNGNVSGPFTFTLGACDEGRLR